MGFFVYVPALSSLFKLEIGKVSEIDIFAHFVHILWTKHTENLYLT